MEYLKIKDEVDLKELEKYGYTLEYSPLYYYNFYGNVEVQIMADTRTITVWCGDIICDDDVNEMASSLFDLIQAGLVEKVVE